MLASVRDASTALGDALAFAPSGLIGALVLALAAVAAIVVHEILVRLLRRLFGDQESYLRSLLRAISGLTRLAFLIIALDIVLPIAPIDPVAIAILARMLTLATIALLGWIAITATHVTGDLYLRRFSLDATDDLLARKHVTQVRILRRVVDTLIIVLTVSAGLMTFESVRQYGVSLFASAGVAGLVVGLAARPMLSNLIAGIQIATTQPIRLGDEVVIETQWGRIEEITSTYVVIKLWDLRRLIVPLSYFMEKAFENWTREIDQSHRRGIDPRELPDADRAGAPKGRGDRAGFAAVGRRRRQARGQRGQGNRARAAGARQRPHIRCDRRFAQRDPGEDDRVPAAGISDLPAAARPCGAAAAIAAAGEDPRCFLTPASQVELSPGSAAFGPRRLRPFVLRREAGLPMLASPAGRCSARRQAAAQACVQTTGRNR